MEELIPVDPSKLATVFELWPHIKEAMQEGDQLCSFSTIRALSGSAGYVIVRNGEIVHRFRTMMS